MSAPRPMPPPKFATPRNFDRPTRGHFQGQFAKIWLGEPFMPWQQYVADVAGELLPNGLPAYPFVVGTLPRRAGKSHYCMARKGERCFCVPNFRSWYTAQTGGDARDQFLKFGEQVAQAPLGAKVRTLIGNGREVMKFPNGSWIRPHPPHPKALHGKDSDDNDVDEAWAFTEDEGRGLIQAIGPTQLTRPGAQTFIWSAGGTADSTWLADLVARGRAGDPRICYFEWGIPDDADAEDLDIIAEHHPAYGHTIGMPALVALRATFGDDTAGWARAAGNRWTEVIGGAISSHVWETVRYGPEIPPGVPVAYGAARAADGSQVVIAAAARIGSLIVCEILEVVPAFGADTHVKRLAATGLCGVVDSGGSKPLATSLEKWRRLVPLSDQDYSAACGTLSDALPLRAYRFRQHIELDCAIQVAAKRNVGDGGFVWSRLAPVAALEACTAAAHVLVTRPQRTGRVVAA